MSQHTPGPWISDDVGPSDIYRYVIANSSNPAGFRKIARVDLSDIFFVDSRKETESNARLIAAAPDLLEALREMYHAFLDPDHIVTDRQEAASLGAYRAIHKATGKTT